MKKISLLALLGCVSTTLMAQRSPVGIVSIQDTTKSVQVGAISSVAADGGKGLQLSTFTNTSGGNFNGAQISAITNLTQTMHKGVQLGGMLNVASGEMGGWQVAAFNYADSLRGAQIGVFNTARHIRKGWQLGIINYTKDTIPGATRIGLVNISPKTTIDWMVFGGNQSKFNFAMRYRNKSTYNIIGIGTHFMGLSNRFSGAVYYRIGQYFQLSPKFSVSGDIGFAHIETFEKSGSDKPKRLYSLQARLNADYQFNKTLGAFASVGWGDTRYYHHSTSYRSRPIIEAGLTLRRHRSNQNDLWQNTHIRKKVAEEYQETGDSTMALEPKKCFWGAALEVTGINVGVHLMDRFLLKEPFVKTTLHSIGENFRRGLVWDNDLFTMNMFAHPYHGNLYFNAARANGLSYWEAAPFALLGSAEWEFFGETTCGGMAIGETLHRLSLTPLDDRTRGWNRFWREAVATLLNPIQGLHRIISGDAWRVKNDHYHYHDFKTIPIQASFSTGLRYVADNGALFRGDYCPYLNIGFVYGIGADGEKHTKPFDFFDFDATFSFGGSQPIINNINIMGRLWSTPIIDRTAKNEHAKSMYGEFGFYQHFNYYDSKPIKDGSELTPYRISEPASFGPGFMFVMEQPKAALTRAEQRVFLSGILLGGTKSDYFNIIERDYNMGSGFSIKTKTVLDFGSIARFTLNAKYFRIFTFKGYKDKLAPLQARIDNGEFTEEYLRSIADDKDKFQEVTGFDLRYLNAQGDRGNAGLLVINPVLEFHLTKQWGIIAQGSYFIRRTYYKYHENVHASTFEAKLGIICRL